MKKLPFNLIMIILLTSLSGLQSCKKSWEPKPPIPGLEMTMQTYTVDAEKGGKVEVPGGTVISFPPSCFVGSDGNPITGSIEIKYREFHDALDIMLSGITMDYYSMGEKRTFQTSGMFEINALQDGKELAIAKNKKIDIRFASKYPGADYNFFYMNPKTGNWEFVDFAQSEPNLEKQERKKSLSEKNPTIAMPMTDYFVLNKNILLDIYFKDDWSKIWDNKTNKKLWDKFREYGMKLYEIRTYGEIQFNRGYYHPVELFWKDLDGKEFPSWTKDFEFDWVERNGQWIVSNMGFTPEGNNTYTIWFKRKGVTFSKRAEVIMPVKNLLKYPATEWQKWYYEAMKEIEKEQAEIDLMAETYRTFSIKRLGLYNYDKLLKLDDWFDVEATYTLSEKNSWPDNQNIILILGDNSGYYTITPAEFNRMRFNPESGHRLISISPDRMLISYPVDKLIKLNSDSLRAIELPALSFVMESKGTINDAVALREMLGFK